jgi:hypothetical protein
LPGASDFGTHRRRVPAVVEARAVVESQAIERRHRPQLDVVGETPPGQRPQLLEQEGRGDHGRPGVEGETVLPVHIGTPTGRVQTLQHGDAVAACAQPHRRGEPAEAAADHDGMRPRGIDACRVRRR